MNFKVVIIIPRGPYPDGLAEKVRELGLECELYHKAENEAELISMCRDADYIMTTIAGIKYPSEVLNKLEKCKFIYTISVGYDGIDMEAATKLGIGVFNLAGFCAEELAEHAMALILGCARWMLGLYNRSKAGNRVPPASKEAIAHMSILKGKTLGLIGLGASGRLVIPKARGFDMKIIGHDPYVGQEFFDENNIQNVDVNTLVKESDFISIHCNLTPETEHLIGMEQFKMTKKRAIIVNVARGAIIDENALITALSENMIAGAGLDVNEVEPVPVESPLWNFNNVIITGHNAGASPESDAVRVDISIDELKRVLRNEWPLRLINKEVKDKYIEKWGKMN